VGIDTKERSVYHTVAFRRPSRHSMARWKSSVGMHLGAGSSMDTDLSNLGAFLQNAH